MHEYDSLLETATPTSDEELERHSTPQLADLLKDPEPSKAEGTGEAGETHSEPEPTKGVKPKTLQEWAEKVGTEVKDLYAVEVPISTGDSAKSVTLGELKDTYARMEDLTQRELELEERRTRQDADLTRAQAELRSLIQALPPKALSEQALNMVRSRAEQELKAEREATLRTIPEWHDESRREAEITGMVEMLKDYGFAPNFLMQQVNHRLIRLVRDAYLRKTRIEKALEQVKEVKRTSPTGKSVPAGAPKAPRRAQSNAASKGPESRLMALLNE